MKPKPPPEKSIYLHQGTPFESTGSGFFAKDVAVDGDFLDEKTGRIVQITPARRRLLAAETNRFLENGNEIPFPDGHTWDAMKNLGDWPGPWMVHGDRLFGVVRPKGDDVVQKIVDGKINRVSMVISKNHVDPKGNFYPEVIIQCCATPVPVLTGQRDFVALSREATDAPVFIPKAEAANDGYREPTFEELAAAFRTEEDPDFLELAEGFKPAPEPAGPSFEELAQGFAAMKVEEPEEKLAQIETLPIVAPPPAPAAPPVTVNVNFSEGSFKPQVDIKQGDVNLEFQGGNRSVELKTSDGKTIKGTSKAEGGAA